MMSPNRVLENRSSANPATFRQTPLQIIHILGNFMRMWSIYTLYIYLSQTGASVLLFVFSCLVPSSLLFLLLQKPWKGRPLSNTQVVPSVINGGVTALYFILWGKGLKSCGPLRAILAEYSGAVLGVLSAVLYGRRGHLWKKVLPLWVINMDPIRQGAIISLPAPLMNSLIGGLFTMFASFYLLSQGWASASYTHLTVFDNSEAEVEREVAVGLKDMLIPIFAGILSTLRRVIARRVSLKNQLKRRLHAITITSATCFMFPIATWDMILGSSSIELPFSAWTFSSTILFGIILIFYVESIAEERLFMVFSSPRHLMVTGGCIIIMEIVYKMDFSLLGFLLCVAMLSFGIHEATSLDRTKKDSSQNLDPLNGVFEDQIQMGSLPT